jgi:hypothetical protein
VRHGELVELIGGIFRKVRTQTLYRRAETDGTPASSFSRTTPGPAWPQ